MIKNDTYVLRQCRVFLAVSKARAALQLMAKKELSLKYH